MHHEKMLNCINLQWFDRRSCLDHRAGQYMQLWRRDRSVRDSPCCTVFCTEVDMKTMSYTESRAKYAEVLDAVVNDREEVVITRAGHEPAVIVSLDDYESLKEMAYLLRNPANARRLLASIERLESGEGEAHELLG